MTVTAVPDGVRALLTDGKVVRIRVLVPSDVDDALELHRRLSERDTYFRFFGFARDFLPTIARRITREPDGKHVALGAYLGDVMVGVAHYETLADPLEAEIAFVVDGVVQARGLGTLLLEHLASVARHRGVRWFVAEVLAENGRMIHVIADAGLAYRTRTDGPESEIVIQLDQDDRYLSAVVERERVSEVASLAAVLRPASVVVLGAGRAPGSVGHAVLRKLVDGGYSGILSAVNPHAEEIAGVRCWPSVADVPGEVQHRARRFGADGFALPGQHRLVDRYPTADQRRVRAHPVARLEQHEITDHQPGGLDVGRATVATHRRSHRQEVTQPFGCPVRAVLLGERERAVEQHHHRDRDPQRGHPGHQRQPSCHTQHEGEEMRQLSAEHHQRMRSVRWRQGVGPVAGQPCRCLLSG